MMRPAPAPPLLLLTIILACAWAGTDEAARTPACPGRAAAFRNPFDSRPFAMGFTRWPPEATMQGVKRMDDFIAAHADLTALHFDGGVPWPRALLDVEYPEAVMNEWRGAREAIPPEHLVYLALTPLDITRSAIAPLWETDTTQPLPAPWDGYGLDHPDVKRAYLNHVRRAVDFFRPDYLAIGIEVNIAQADSAGTWEAYKDLHRSVYQALKREHPMLPIFATFTNTHMNGLDGGRLDEQKKEIAELLEFSDRLGLSVYPFGWPYGPGRTGISENLFDTALAFGKPVVIAESGMPSRSFEAFGQTYEFQEADQVRWLEFLLRKAGENRLEFVVNWVSLDFDRLLEYLPAGDLRELAAFWAYTGLERSDGCGKPALTVWDSYLHLERD
jgi:hypothetical protein